MEVLNRRKFIGRAAVGLAFSNSVESEELEQTTQKETINEPQKVKVEKALSFLKKYNCCTAVFAAYAPELGIDEKLAAGITRSMPGIGGLGYVCGTVSGATMVIGLKNTVDPEVTYDSSEIVREFVTKFKEIHSSIECRNLLGWDISSPEKFKVARENNAFANCPKYVTSAVELIEKLIS